MWDTMIYVKTIEQHKKAQLYLFNKGYEFRNHTGINEDFFRHTSLVYAVYDTNAVHDNKIYTGQIGSFEAMVKNYRSNRYLDFSKNTLMETE